MHLKQDQSEATVPPYGTTEIIVYIEEKQILMTVTKLCADGVELLIIREFAFSLMHPELAQLGIAVLFGMYQIVFMPAELIPMIVTI